MLAVLADVAFFGSFRDGRFHLEAMYLQHVAMSSAAFGPGVALAFGVPAREEQVDPAVVLADPSDSPDRFCG